MRKIGFVSKRRTSAGSSRLALVAMIAVGCAPGIAAAQTSAATASAPASSTAASSTASNGVGSAFELAFWQSLTGSEDSASYEAYLAKYPDGTFSGLARAKIAALQRALTVQPAAAPFAPATPVPAPVPATIPVAAPVGAPAVVGASALQPTPAVVTATATTPATGQIAAAATQTPEMIPANASVGLAEQSSPLTRLLAQLRGGSDAATASPAPLVPAAPAVLPAAAAAPISAAPSPTQQAVYTPTPVQASAQAAGQVLALVPAADPAPVAAPYASARPVMLTVPEVAIPAYFCSNDARNVFHNGSYRPAVEAATRNNEAAVAYLRQLQQTYDRGQLGRDTAVLNAIAAEARAYQAEAARAYSAQATLVRQFDVLMAVPLRTCLASAQ